MLSLLMLFIKLDSLNNTAYAFTVSLGNGYGRVFYCKSYYELPPILRESVNVHERQHLLDGTICNQIEGEIRAYTVQLEDLRAKIVDTRVRYRQTGDPLLGLDLQYLKSFEKDTLSLLKEYEAKRR